MLFFIRRQRSFYIARQGLIAIQPSMEEKMCQQRKSTSKHTQTKHLYQQSPHLPGCHQCKICSSFSATSSSSSSISSTSSSMSFSKDNSRRSSLDKKNNGCFIQQHLQSMFNLFRREETLKMVSPHPEMSFLQVLVTNLCDHFAGCSTGKRLFESHTISGGC